MYFRIKGLVSSVGIGKYLLAALLCALIASLAACGGGGDTAASPAAGESGNQATAMVQEPEVKIQLVCINRTGNPCTLIYSTEEEQGTGGFIERVKDRTNGRVEFQVSSFPELGLA